MDIFYSEKGLTFENFIKYPEIKIEENSFTFITGKSGCGKSSYLKMLNFTALPSEGKIYYCGKDLREVSPIDYRREVMLVPQQVFLIDGNIRDNFDFYYEMRDMEPLTNVEISDFLKICCLDFPLTADCSVLSGGERQRVFLSIFISCNPKVLLLDEPTAALDEKTSNELFTSLKEYRRQRNITVVCVCHNLELAEKYGDSIIRLGEEQ